MSRPTWLRAPADLSPGAKTFWKQHAAHLHAKGELTPQTVGDFLVLAVLSDALQRAAVEIGEAGVVLTAKSGTKKQHPALAAMLAARREIEQIWHKLRQPTGPWGM